MLPPQPLREADTTAPESTNADRTRVTNRWDLWRRRDSNAQEQAMDAVTRLAEVIESKPAATSLGLLAGTQVRTLDGLLPVEYLAPGDRVVTRSGAKRLQAVSVQLRKRVMLVRIRATTLGHDRPENDLLLASGQPVLIRDWRARALYGVEAAAIPVARLADGEFVVSELAAEARLYTLRFAENEVIYAEGLEVACPAAEMATSSPVPLSSR
ncbi:MAG: hypothetical protein C0524_17900 [Rhodobacter sp.]|nr:hypothetical protein [Rhodobacter sp.]